MNSFDIFTILYNHQNEAVNKMLPTRVGALFMEMGTGKTLTALQLIKNRYHKIDKVVWFCPVSLKETIHKEVIKHTNIKNIYNFNNKTTEETIQKDMDFYIVGIESMSLSNRTILCCDKLISNKTYVVVDESSFIKGYKSKRTDWITRVCEKSMYRLILTGTPISQGIIDLYSQMKFLSPKILGYRSFYSFSANHIEYSEKYKNMIVRTFNEDYIAEKIKPYVYQVTKKDCLDLPSKINKTIYFDMTSNQKTYYEYIKSKIMSTWNDEFNSYDIFKLLSALQQIVSGFYNNGKEIVTIEHDRISTLLNIIEMIDCSKKIIIWAKYVFDIENICGILTKKYGEGCCVAYYGNVNEKVREVNVEKFKNNKDTRFFVATQSCGGYGLTLNESNVVIFYNNDFKYNNRLQAEDRCHRIGQTEPVTYIDICCNAKIDEKILDCLCNKENIVTRFKNEIEKIKDYKKLKQKIKDDL